LSLYCNTKLIFIFNLNLGHLCIYNMKIIKISVNEMIINFLRFVVLIAD